MLTLKYKTVFSASHQLTRAYDNLCNDNLHGHNWKVIIEIGIDKEPIKSNNWMIVDFKKLKEVVSEYDHKNLNEIFIDRDPTAEMIACELFKKIVNLKELKQYKGFLKISVWETDNSRIQRIGKLNN